MSAAASPRGRDTAGRSGSEPPRSGRTASEPQHSGGSAEAIYRVLLRAFPADFRRLHERDAVELFRDRLREARRGGLRERVGFWLRNVVDAIGQGISERRAAARADRATASRSSAASGGRARAQAAGSARRCETHTSDPNEATDCSAFRESGSARTPESGRSAPPGRHAGPPRPAALLGLERWLQGARLTARNLARSPLYAGVVIIVFALTIMAVTTVSSAIESLLWRPLPFPEADRLVFVGETSAEADGGAASVTSRYVLERVRREVEGLQGLAVFNIWGATLTGVGDPRRLGGARVSWNYFDTLAVPPHRGRSFTADDGVPGAERVVIISHRLWRGRFGGDEGVIGRVIRLSEQGYEVVGVMPARFETPDQYTFTRTAADIWTPFQVDRDDPEQIGEPGGNYLRGVARRAPGVGMAAVEARLEALRSAIGDEYPRWAETERIAALPLQHQFTVQMQHGLWILAGAVGLVLLVGSVNVMNLILSRTIDRGHELAVRSALGAGRGHLLGHGVVEALLLALPGGVAGVLMAHGSLRALVAASPSTSPLIESISIGPLSVLVALTLTLTAALLAGLVPGVRVLRRLGAGDLSLRSGAGQGADGPARSLLAVVQVALAVMLLVAAGLLTRSFQELLRVDPGFDPTGVYVAQIDLPSGRYEDAEARTLFGDRLARSLEALADVAAAGLVTSVPQHSLNNLLSGIGIAGREADPDNPPRAFFRGVSPGYFDAAGLRLRRGRTLRPEDFKAGRGTAVVINEELERRYFDGEEALGATLQVLGEEGLEVVGVVADVQYGWFGRDPQPETYAPWQGRMNTVFLVVKGARDSADIAALMKHEVQALDSDLPMDELWRLEALAAESLASDRMAMLLMLILAGFTVLLSAMGTYAVIAHMVARRTAEIGIRMALGARSDTVLRMVLARVLRIALAGSVIGLALAWVSGRLFESLLFGVSARDPMTFGVVTLFVLAASLLACLHPARRASSVDPVIALRNG